jgi:hypothetical protein
MWYSVLALLVLLGGTGLVHTKPLVELGPPVIADDKPLTPTPHLFRFEGDSFGFLLQPNPYQVCSCIAVRNIGTSCYCQGDVPICERPDDE